MDFGDVPAWVAAVVAGGAAVIALIAARYSRRQADAAEAALGEARRNATAAETQAETAREQLALMRTQLDEARAERDEREGPVFEIGDAVLCDEKIGQPAVKVTVTMLSGPPSIRVEAGVRGHFVRSAFRSNPEQTPAVFREVSPGRKFVVYALREYRKTKIDATLELACVENGEKRRTWLRQHAVRFEKPPAEPVDIFRQSWNH